MARRKKDKVPAVKGKKDITAVEREQVRIRRNLGHEFALADDKQGRQRLNKKTAEGKRRYSQDRQNRVRIVNADPLSGIKLSTEQREAAEVYRDAAEMVESHGMKSADLGERVDSAGSAGGFPERVVDAATLVRMARVHLLPPHMETIHGVCVGGESLRTLSARLGKAREVVKDRLETGLDHLAKIYRIRPSRRRG